MTEKNTKGAMEMSVGTIVTIVLLMSVLVLGIFFIQKIFKSSNGALDLTDQQLQDQLQALYSNGQDNLAVLPQSRTLDISPGDVDAFGVGVKNTERGGDSISFGYKVEASGDDNKKNCGRTNEILNTYIRQGSSEEGIVLSPGSTASRKVRIEIPQGAPLCLVRYKITVLKEGTPLNSDYFDINIK